jgi:hypothetical protein
MRRAGLSLVDVVVFGFAFAIVASASSAFGIERIANLSRRYSTCSKLRPDQHLTQEERAQSRAYLECLLQPLTPDAQKVCDQGGECEKVGLFRAISIIHESVDGDYSLQTPIRLTQKTCAPHFSLGPSLRVVATLETSGFEFESPVGLPWTGLCLRGKTLVDVVDILMVARLKTAKTDESP